MKRINYDEEINKKDIVRENFNLRARAINPDITEQYDRFQTELSNSESNLEREQEIRDNIEFSTNSVSETTEQIIHTQVFNTFTGTIFNQTTFMILGFCAFFFLGYKFSKKS